MFIKYYHKLFTSEVSRGLEECLDAMPRRFTIEMNEQLIKEFTTVEISSALNQMAPLKTLGPNGFPASFHHQNWAIIGEEVCNIVLSFSNSSQLDGDINLGPSVFVTFCIRLLQRF